MWGGIEKILETVSSYSTNAGKLWYLLVFVFRLIVVVTIGQSVYSDEQSAFRCSTKVIGCDNVCYDRFSKISHIRYWAFQLIAVTAPAVVFHFYSLNVKGRIEKIKIAENDGVDDDWNGSVFSSVRFDAEDRKRNPQFKERRKLSRRRKSVGAYKFKKVYANSHLVDVTVTRKIRIGYYMNVLFRIFIEAMSLYLAYQLFHFTDYTVEKSSNPLEFIMIRVPQVYRCDGENVKWACGQHLSLGDTSGYVPCWVSRPYEKTIFMCYMNVLSALCLLLSVIELLQLTFKYSMNFTKKRRQTTGSECKTSDRNSRVSECPLVRYKDEIDGKPPKVTEPRDVSIKIEKVWREENKVVQPNGAVFNQNPTIISMKDINKYKKIRPMKYEEAKKGKTLKKGTVGITMQEDGEESAGSGGYHSSEYESSSSGEETPPSVSIGGSSH